MADDFHREPCFWTSTTPGYNTRDRQRTFMSGGEKVTEKYPQRGHAGDYEDRRKANGVRFIRVVDHYGHEIFHTLTNAAAHLDHTAPFGQYMMQKSRFLGWFMPNHCPCALLSTGELAKDQIVSAEVRSGKACEPGTYSYESQCPHSKAERAARLAKTTVAHDKRELAMKADSTKNLEATQEMTKMVAEAVAALANSQAEKKSKADK